MKRLGIALALALALALTAFAGDQGKPGTQGPWPVAIVSGGLLFDGGTAVLMQSVSADGGTAWIAGGSIIPSSTRWTLCAEFDLAAWLAAGNSIPALSTSYAVGFPPDGGTTLEIGPALSGGKLSADLALRITDCPGYAVMVTLQAAGCNTLLSINAYVYGHSDAIVWLKDAGVTAITGYGANFTNSSGTSTGFVFEAGWGSSYVGTTPVYVAPVRPPLLYVTVGPASTLALTSCSRALYQVRVMQ